MPPEWVGFSTTASLLSGYKTQERESAVSQWVGFSTEVKSMGGYNNQDMQLVSQLLGVWTYLGTLLGLLTFRARIIYGTTANHGFFFYYSLMALTSYMR